MLSIVVFLLAGGAFSEAFLAVAPYSKSRPNHLLSVAPKVGRSSIRQGMKFVIIPMKFVHALTRL